VDSALRLTVLVPVYNDWSAATALLAELRQVLPPAARILFVNDGSNEPPPIIARADVLDLHYNLGHQRALCCGFVQLFQDGDCDAVLVMDADGEDGPQDVPRLLNAFREEGSNKMIFASRARRTEGVVFKVFYAIYRTLHRLFVGFDIRIGNFSLIPFSAVSALVRSGHLWNHYAAAALKSRLPLSTVPIAKSKRMHGQSSMSFLALMIHGLSALAVNIDVIAARTLVGVVIALVVGVIAIVVAPASLTAGFVLLILMQVVVIAVLFTLGVLMTRAIPAFIPLRDAPYFIAGIRRAP
jgi:polyisoprenyl-phosphate glycosyltransferase